MLSNLYAFFEENDIELETMNRTILSVKEHLKILEEEISRYFPNLRDTSFALASSPFTIRVEDVPENAQEEFIELITSNAPKQIILQCQLPNLGSRLCSHILFCLRFFLFQQHTFVKQAFQACWSSNLNTGADLLQKMICVVLLQRLLRGFQIWQERSKHTLITDAFWFSQF